MKIVQSLGSAALAALLASGTQEARSQDGAEDEEIIDVVVVTARKREESITDIPISITAFSAEDIEAIGMQSIADLPAVTPGFVYEKFAGIPGRFDNSPRFRGISVNSLAPSRQTASVFIDGIFVSNGIQGIGLEDVERIEVIKGPQSAYFGRLTFGGAVNYVTKTPGEEFKGRISAMAADRSDYQVQASVEGPLASWVKGRLSVSYRDKGGHYRAENDGTELGAEETSAIGGTLFFTPSDNLEIKLRGYYYENDDGAPAYTFSGLDDHNCGPFGGTDTTICGDAQITPLRFNSDVSDGLRDRLLSLPSVLGPNRTQIGLERESTRLSLQFNYDVPGTSMTLSGLFGSNDEEVQLLRDADDSSDEAYFSFANRKFEDDSQELRLSGLNFDDRLQWSIGVNHFEQDFANNGTFIVPPLGFLNFNAAPALEAISTTGIFGSLIYDVTDTVTITLEGRQQKDEVDDDGNTDDMVPPESVEFDNFLPRAIVEWQATQDALLYASFSEGNLPGGFNAEVANLSDAQLAELRAIQSDASAAFREEQLDNIELGWKQVWNNGAGVTTLAIFNMERTDQTFRRADIVSDPNDPTGVQQVDYFINAGKSEVNGLEFEGDYAFTEGFSVGATLAYIDSEFKVFNSGVHAEVFGSPDASGRRAERFPEWSGSVSASFNGKFSNGLDWFARTDAFYQGERFADEINLTTAPSGYQINLRAGIRTDNYRIEAFVTNLTDDETPTAINRFRDLSFDTSLFDFSTLGYQLGLRDRRQVGIRATYEF
ncbi:MAG: TonB-dependent receptor [Pseudomonadota bacterium]